jgi:hypothetical protein
MAIVLLQMQPECQHSEWLKQLFEPETDREMKEKPFVQYHEDRSFNRVGPRERG